MAATLGGLGINGKLLVLGAAGEPMETNLLWLLGGRRSIQGWPAGTAMDSEDTMNFAIHAGVRPMIEEYPLERAAEAYARMLSGAARFRVVLTTGQ
jgi:D-arabinose 1-dehydrogenase-like Zn-dependent alcohol dehydrogenase